MIRFALIVLALLSSACTKPADSSKLSNRPPGGSLPRPDGNGDPANPGSSEPLPAYRSGKRLQAKVYQAADGAKSWHGWHDSQLGVDCTFAMAEDSTQRCLPHADNYAYFYLDAACKAPVYVHFGQCQVPGYVALNQGCANVVFEPNEQIGVGAVYRSEGGACVETEVPAGGTLYTLVHKPADIFVSGAEVYEPRGALEARFLQADDGAVRLLGAYDPNLGSACSPIAPEYADRCAPEPAVALPAAALRYIGEQCETQVMGVPVQCGLPTSSAAGLILPDTPCGTSRLVTLGASHEGQASIKVDNSCSPAEGGGAVRHYEVGAAIDPGTLPELGTLDEGTGRIRTRYRTSDGQIVAHVGFVDSVSGEECHPVTTPAGLRCVPKVGAHALYSDSACQNPLAEVYRGADCQARPSPTGVLSRTDTECGETTFRYFKVGGETSPSELYLNGAACENVVIDTADTTFFETAEVPATEFPEVQDVME